VHSVSGARVSVLRRVSAADLSEDETRDGSLSRLSHQVTWRLSGLQAADSIVLLPRQALP